MNNPVKIDGNVATVYVTRKGVVYEMLIDASSIQYLSGTVCVNKSNSGNNLYAITQCDKIADPVHRILTNCPRNKIVEHINGNTLDNRLSNLRIVSVGQSRLNKKTNNNIPNIKFNGRYYMLSFCRRLYSKDIAERALSEITEIFDRYSNEDAENR